MKGLDPRPTMVGEAAAHAAGEVEDGDGQTEERRSWSRRRRRPLVGLGGCERPSMRRRRRRGVAAADGEERDEGGRRRDSCYQSQSLPSMSSEPIASRH